MEQPSLADRCRNSRDAGYSNKEMRRQFHGFLQAPVWGCWRTHSGSPRTPLPVPRAPHCSLSALLPLNLYFEKCFVVTKQRSGLLKNTPPISDVTASVLESDPSSRSAARGRAGVPQRTGGPAPRACLPARPTFEQLHRAQLEGDAVLLGEDVDGAAGLGY